MLNLHNITSKGSSQRVGFASQIPPGSGATERCINEKSPKGSASPPKGSASPPAHLSKVAEILTILHLNLKYINLRLYERMYQVILK